MIPSGLWIETSPGEAGANLAFVNESADAFGAKVIVERGQAMKNAWARMVYPAGPQLQIPLKVSNLGV